MRQGILITNGVILERHEMMTVNFLLGLGIDIELIPKSNKVGVRTPDLRMLGSEWEMKSPRGRGKWLLKNTMQRASHQSQNVIIDLRRAKQNEREALQEIERHFLLSKRLKRIKIITKSQEVIDFCK